MAPSVKSDKQMPSQETEELTAKLWMPVLFFCLYVAFLRSSYFSFKEENASPDVVFGDVWLSAPAVSSVLYLCTIFGLKKFMEDRAPFAIKDWMFTYNLYQTVFNTWCVYAFIKEVYDQGMSVWGSKMDTTPAGYRLGFLIWAHYNNKYLELLDTVFMAVRKKNKQISFLHMYHHVLLIWSWYAVCKLSCGGDAYFGALCNSFVHVLMYGYYLLALLKINTPWKKWLTNIQMLQFAVCFVHALYVFYVESCPRVLTLLQMWVMLNMLLLFGRFHRQTYAAKQKAKEQQQQQQVQDKQSKMGVQDNSDEARKKAA